MDHWRQAIELDPNCAEAYYGIGNQLRAKRELDDSIRHLRRAVEIQPNYVSAHVNLGIAFIENRDLDAAIRHFELARDLDGNDSMIHNNLCLACYDKGDMKAAIHHGRRALDHDPRNSSAQFNLARALAAAKDWDGAIRHYRASLEIDPDYAEAHCNLGHTYLAQGRFAEAARWFKTGHELGTRKKGWRYPSEEWLAYAERMFKLDGALPDVVQGKFKPHDTAEVTLLIYLCQHHREHFATAARLYGELFVAEPKLADDLDRADRYNAACAAVLAGCGQGADAAQLDDQQRARLRNQALDWLRADLSDWKILLAKLPVKTHRSMFEAMRRWQQDSDLASVRDTNALAKLPEAEQQPWQMLWAEVEQTLVGAAATSSPVPNK